jgi:hypothetical protein
VVLIERTPDRGLLLFMAGRVVCEKSKLLSCRSRSGVESLRTVALAKRSGSLRFALEIFVATGLALRIGRYSLLRTWQR